MNRTKLGRGIIGAALTILLSGTALSTATAAAPAQITWQETISDGASYVYGQVPAAPTCTATDDLGSVACVVTGYDTAVGTHVLTATATSADATTTTATRSYTVQAWTLKGFRKPVKTGAGVWNWVKAGRTVPLKFTVFQGATKARDTAVVASITAQQISCTDQSAVGSAAPITSTRKGYTLKYRHGAFQQNWKTPRVPSTATTTTLAKGGHSSNGKSEHAVKSSAKTSKTRLVSSARACYQVVVTTQDGSKLTALFALR